MLFGNQAVLFLQFFAVARFVAHRVANGNTTTASASADDVCEDDRICLCGQVDSYMALTSLPPNLTRAAAWVGSAALPVKSSFPARIVVCERLGSFPENNSWDLELTALVLRNGGMTEIRRSYVGNFTKLEFVDFSRNKITQIESDSFSSLQNLQELDLSYNQLKSIDVHAARFASVPVMRLRANPIECTCDLWQLANQVVLIPCDDYFSCVLPHRQQQIAGSRRLNGSTTLRRQQENWRIKWKIDFSSKLKLEEEFNEICQQEHKDSTGSRSTTTTSTSSGGTSEAGKGPGDETTPISGVDVNLLVIMALWFFMVYFGINKFIKDNMLDKDMCLSHVVVDSRRWLDVPEVGRKRKQKRR